jgi:very-short-patch-repair endonuclease
VRDERWITHLLCGRIHIRPSGVGDDAAAAALARRQEGIAGRAQLLELGLSGRAIDYRVAVGRLRPLFLGVYAVGHEAVSPNGRALAAVMSFSPYAAASFLTAAALRGVGQPPSMVHVSGPRTREPRPGAVYHRAVLPDNDWTVIAGIPTTTLPRTFLDLSATLPEDRLRRMVKDAEFKRLLRVDELVEILDRYPRRRGRQALARIVKPLIAGSHRTASTLEDRFLEFCERRRLPMPETNVALVVAGRRYVPDCLWRGPRLIVELDGRDAHARELAFEEDRARDRALAAAGWVPIRVTSGQLAHQPGRLETELRAILALWARRSSDERRIHHSGRG